MNRAARLGGHLILWRWWLAEQAPWAPGLLVFAAIVAAGVWFGGKALDIDFEPPP